MNRPRPSVTGGFSLIELLVALAITALLIIGAVTMYSQSRNTFRTAEAVARLQENARYALSFVETDLRMANYWGLNSRPDYIQTGGLTINACQTGWATNFDQFVQGSNGVKGLSDACIPPATGNDERRYKAGTDVITIRRVAADRETGDLDEDTVYLQTSRIQGTLFLAESDCSVSDESCLPAGYLPPQSETHQLIAHTYYVSPNSTGRTGVPSLRRVRLINGPAAASEEIIAGVEDLQLEFGIDTDNDATVEYFIAPPASALAAGARVVAVRVWLRVRSDEPDFTFKDERTYNYAGVNNFKPGATGDEDRYRRLLVSKTIQLRNTRHDE